jgi:FkbM family methyltransferase
MPDHIGGLSFTCDLRDGLMREVCFTGLYEPQETVLLRRLLRKGMTVVDVGASWGYFTLVAAHLVGETGRVLAVEPDPRTFRLLAENLRHNGLRHVRAIPAAAARYAGVLTLHGFRIADGNFGLSRVVDAQIEGDNIFHVPGIPLDELIGEAGLGKIDFLKMDVEGAEGDALAGLTRAMSSHQIRWLLLELHPAELAERGESIHSIFAELKKYGYQPWLVNHSRAATRAAAYGRRQVEALLRPLSEGAELGTWPHVLWRSPLTN